MGRILRVRDLAKFEIDLAPAESLDDIPEDGPCEVTIVVHDREAFGDLLDRLVVGACVDVAGSIKPFAYSEDDGERVVSLSLVASEFKLVAKAPRATEGAAGR